MNRVTNQFYEPWRMKAFPRALVFVINTKALTWGNKKDFLRLWGNLGEWLCCRLEEEFSFGQQSASV